MLSGAVGAAVGVSAVGCWALVTGEVGAWEAVVRSALAVLFAALPFECSDVLALSAEGFVAFFTHCAATCSRLAAAAEACRIFLRKVFTKAFDDSVAVVVDGAIVDGATEMVGEDLESASVPASFLAFLAAEALDLGCNSACFAWSSVAFSVFEAAVFAPLAAAFFLPQQRLCATFAVEG